MCRDTIEGSGLTVRFWTNRWKKSELLYRERKLLPQSETIVILHRKFVASCLIDSKEYNSYRSTATIVFVK